MAVKFHCPKCDRRFIDWGAEKLGFKCPECDDSTLLRIGAAEEAPKAAPKLKRKKEVEAPPEPKVPDLDDSDTVDLDSGDDDDNDDDIDSDGVVDDEPLD